MGETAPKDSASVSAPKRAYWCFISYRHADNREAGREWASWLHHGLETFQVPRDLVGKTNERGEILPAQIFPVFRDEEELAGGHLKQGIREALQSAKSLVVLCSPRALESAYVDEEIRIYKRLRNAEVRAGAKCVRAEPMAVILEGNPEEPPGSLGACIPAALRFEVDEGGLLTERPSEESLWIDFRLPDGGQGWTSSGAYREALERASGLGRAEIAARANAYHESLEKARLRLIAGILGVPYGELQKRDSAYRLARARKRARTLAAVLAVVILFALAALVAGIVAVQQRGEAVRQRDVALARGEAIKSNAEWMNYDLRDILTTYAPAKVRVEATERLDSLVHAVEALPDSVSGAEESDADVLRARLAADLQKADAILAHAGSDPVAALPLVENALRLARQIVRGPSSTPRDERNLAVACNKTGDLKMRLGRGDEARALYGESIRVIERLVKAHPSNPEYGRDLGLGYARIGDAGLAMGRTAEARDFYGSALKVARRLDDSSPGNPQYQRDLAAACARTGEVELRLGNAQAARDFFREGLEVALALAGAEPDVASHRRDLGVCYNRLGDAELKLGNTHAAREYFEKDLALAREQVASDPDNAKYRRDLVAAHARLGAFFEESDPGAREQAVVHYRAVIAVFDDLKTAGALMPQDEEAVAIYRAKLDELQR